MELIDCMSQVTPDIIMSGADLIIYLIHKLVNTRNVDAHIHDVQEFK